MMTTTERRKQLEMKNYVTVLDAILATRRARAKGGRNHLAAAFSKSVSTTRRRTTATTRRRAATTRFFVVLFRSRGGAGFAG
jgi:hypothetical protein